MRTWIVVAAVAVLAVAGGGAFYGLEVYPQQAFRAGLDQSLATLPPGTTVTYKDAHYAPVTGLATLTGVTVHGTVPGDRPQPFDVTIDIVETTHPNLEFANAWAKAAANPATAAPDTALLVADAIALKGVTFRSAAISANEDFARVAKLRLYPWALLHQNMPAWKDIEASLTRRADHQELADLQPILRAEAAIMLGIAYESYEVGATKGTETLPELDIAYTVRKMAGGAFDRGVLTAGTAEGITVTGNRIGTFSVDRVSVGASGLREPMTRILNGEALSPALLTGINVGRIEYTGITAQPPGMAGTRIGGFSMGPVVFAQGMPVAMEVGLSDVSVSRAQMPGREAKDAFDKLGLQTMTVSFALAYNWDVAQQRASFHDTMLKVNELGTLTLSAELTSLAPNLIALARAQFAHAKLRFEDASLVDRLLRMGAAGSGETGYRQQIVAMVQQQSEALGADSPAIVAAGKSVAAFITEPHSLTVELAPPKPVPLMSLESQANDPGALATALGLTVTANQP